MRVEGGGKVSFLEPLLSHTTAPMEVTTTLEATDFWDQDVS